MWLCEYCDAGNVGGNNVCAECGKENTLPAKKAANPTEYEFCTNSMRLKKWGKILMIACFGMGLLQFILRSLNFWTWDAFMFGATPIMMLTQLLPYLITTIFHWLIRGILIKLVADALAIIVQSSHLNIKSKTKEGE